MPRREQYSFSVNFSTDIGIGANSAQSVKIDTGAAFFVQKIVGTAWDSSNLRPFLKYPGPTAASNTESRWLSTLSVMIAISGVQWFNVPVLWSNLVGDVWDPNVLLVEREIKQGNDIGVTLYNNNTSIGNLQAQITFEGYKLWNS